MEADRFEDFSFGSVRIDGTAYRYDVAIDRGEVPRSKKKASKKFRDAFGHTPLSLAEKIPWKCHRLVIGNVQRGGVTALAEAEAAAKRTLEGTNMKAPTRSMAAADF